MNRIVLLCSGTRIRWSDLTGMPHPKVEDKAVLRKHAETAMKIDPQITGYEIVSDKDEPRRRILARVLSAVD